MQLLVLWVKPALVHSIFLLALLHLFFVLTLSYAILLPFRMANLREICDELSVSYYIANLFTMESCEESCNGPEKGHQTLPLLGLCLKSCGFDVISMLTIRVEQIIWRY
jgi:hypothetical protein